jgi:hypothetical protein
MERKYDQFVNYNWNDCEKWRIYFFNLTPTPTDRNIIMNYRKKFYQRNIDPDFDINYIPGSKYTPKPNNEKTQQPENFITDNKSIYSNFIAAVEAFLWASFFFNLLSRVNITVIALFALFVRVLREHGISFAPKYVENLMKSDYIHLMFYTCILMLDEINYLLIFPLSITGLFSICEYFSNHLRVLKFLKKYFDYVIEKKDDVISLRSFSYLVVAFYLPFGFLLGFQKIYFVGVFYLFLRGLYYCSESLQKLCFRLRVIIEDYIERPESPGLVKILLGSLVKLCLFLNK